MQPCTNSDSAVYPRGVQIAIKTQNSGTKGNQAQGEYKLSISQVIMIIYRVNNTTLSSFTQ